MITFIDLAGHHKYLHTTIFGLTSYCPDCALLLVSANTGIGKRRRRRGSAHSPPPGPHTSGSQTTSPLVLSPPIPHPDSRPPSLSSWHHTGTSGAGTGPESALLHRGQQGGPVCQDHRGEDSTPARAGPQAAWLPQGSHAGHLRGRRCHCRAAVCPIPQVRLSHSSILREGCHRAPEHGVPTPFPTDQTSSAQFCGFSGWDCGRESLLKA